MHHSWALLILMSTLSSDRFLITCICRSGPANCSVNFGISLDWKKTLNDLKCSYTFALYQIKCKTRSSMCDTAILNYSSNFSNLLPNTKITEFPKCLFLKLNQKTKSFCTVYQHYEKQHLLSGYFQNSHKAVLYFWTDKWAAINFFYSDKLFFKNTKCF